MAQSFFQGKDDTALIALISNAKLFARGRVVE